MRAADGSEDVEVAARLKAEGHSRQIPLSAPALGHAQTRARKQARKQKQKQQKADGEEVRVVAETLDGESRVFLCTRDALVWQLNWYSVVTHQYCAELQRQTSRRRLQIKISRGAPGPPKPPRAAKRRMTPSTR